MIENINLFKLRYLIFNNQYKIEDFYLLFAKTKLEMQKKLG